MKITRIDWDEIDEKYRYAALTQDGRLILCTRKMDFNGRFWCSKANGIHGQLCGDCECETLCEPEVYSFQRTKHPCEYSQIERPKGENYA